MPELSNWNPHYSLIAVWVGILLGLVSGAVIGLGFHRDDWLGGYGSWRRRMLRLGHISFFGVAMLNLAFHLTGLPLAAAGWLFIAGAVLMPTVCFLSAWRKPWRHAFVLPVVCLIAAAGLVAVNLIMGTAS